MKRGKKKENQRWCLVTRTATVSEENTAIFQMQDVSREADAAVYESSVCVGGGMGGREEKGPDLLILRLLSFDGRGLCF